MVRGDANVTTRTVAKQQLLPFGPFTCKNVHVMNVHVCIFFCLFLLSFFFLKR